jgi:hypothetical protein
VKETMTRALIHDADPDVVEEWKWQLVRSAVVFNVAKRKK